MVPTVEASVVGADGVGPLVTGGCSIGSATSAVGSGGGGGGKACSGLLLAVCACAVDPTVKIHNEMQTKRALSRRTNDLARTGSLTSITIAQHQADAHNVVRLALGRSVRQAVT